ncbi:DUF4252 domain-containing protein [Halpernia frigidisoli]|uniref:DUF4252 domain-containing protein n=1 Tax=Halpernia frigidisoli TaxID=1125876 RepID=A0A1I3GIQ9_9FLAO|nr:DUF4252 domain-containing protein [Halpernia frigidisoli]SFI23356.1 protein of unknown function [Halpernia frigidisoli]
MKSNFILKTAFFTLLIFALQSCIVSSRPNIDYFNGAEAKNSEAQFTSVNVPLFLAKPMIRKALKDDKDEDSKQLRNLIGKISRVKIMTVENGDTKLVSNYAKYLTDNNYEDWMSIKHNGENVNIKAQQSGDMIKKLLLTVNSGKELVYIDIRGKFTPQDITDLINATNK